MSCFQIPTLRPGSRLPELATWIDDYFGRHVYGVQFSDGMVYRGEECQPWHLEGVDTGQLEPTDVDPLELILDDVEAARDAMQVALRFTSREGFGSTMECLGILNAILSRHGRLPEGGCAEE